MYTYTHIYLKDNILLPYETIFKAIDESGEEIMKIFSELDEKYCILGIRTASRFLNVVLFWFSDKPNFCSDYIIIMHYVP